jgi:predicted nucleic acid-binding protein
MRLRRCSSPELLWDSVGDHLALLRSRGLIIPLADAAVATLGIHMNVEVWARDQHFQHMQTVLPGLQLFREPP